MNDKLGAILVPALAGIIGLLGIIVLAIMGRPVPDILVAVSMAFAGWAFGTGVARVTNGRASSRDTDNDGGNGNGGQQ